jgi:hypothetical protein
VQVNGNATRPPEAAAKIATLAENDSTPPLGKRFLPLCFCVPLLALVLWLSLSTESQAVLMHLTFYCLFFTVAICFSNHFEEKTATFIIYSY